jgi:ribosomal protein L20
LLYEDRCVSFAAVSRQTKKRCLRVLYVVRIYSARQFINIADLTERLQYVIVFMKTYTE